MMAVTSVMRAQQILLARLNEALEEFGLTFARYEALMLLYFSRAGSLPLGKMGARLQVHPASVTNLVDGLERAGYVQRTPHPSDRRTMLATITPGRDGGRVGDRRAARDAVRHRAAWRRGADRRDGHPARGPHGRGGLRGRRVVTCVKGRTVAGSMYVLANGALGDTAERQTRTTRHRPDGAAIPRGALT